MACTVLIQDVLGQGQPGSILTSLRVAGSATGCTSVSVSIVCTSQQAVTHPNVPVSAGQWQTVFNEQELKIAGCQECGSPSYPITVRVHCADPGSSCSDAKIYSEIPCQTACPTIESIATSTPSCSEVLAAGGYDVTFTAPINGGNVTYCVWSFGDGTDPVVTGSPSGGVATAQHTYDCAGEYPVSLTILSDCEPGYSDSAVVQLVLPPCGCPTVTELEAHADAANPCLWKFMAKIGPPFVGCIESYLWNFGDGHQEVTDVPEVDHVYGEDGPYVVTLTIQGGIGPPGGGLCDTSKHIQVTGCTPAGGGDGGGNGKPCRWWDPRCWKNPCGALLASAMAAIVAAFILFIVAGCVVVTPALLAGPVAALIEALVASAIFIAATAALALGLALLTTWFLVCAHLPGYHFCSALHDAITAISWIIVVQSLLALAMVAVGGWGCLVGLVFAWVGYGTVLAYLQLISNWAGCHHS